MCDYNIYSIRSYNNDKLVFYNYTKRKRIGDILSGYKTRYKRHLNNKDNWINVFYILKEDNSYIKIEENIINSNDEIVKSRLCEIIADNKCINKRRNEDIEKLCNKKEPKNTENEIQNKTEIIEEVITEIIEEPKTEPTNTETKIVKYIEEEVADISNNQVELLNDTITEFNEPSNNIKVVKNLADVKCIDKIYEPSIISSSRHSRPSFKQQLEQQIEQLKPNYNRTIKINYNDVVKIMNKKNTTLKNKYN